MSELSVDIRDATGVAGTVIVTLNGPIDARTVIVFKTQIESAKGRGLRTFVMDMEKVTYINSTGLSYLISLADSGDTSRPGLVLLKVQAKVKVLFDMMGLGALFRFAYSLEEALQGLGAASSKTATAAEPAPPAPAAPPRERIPLPAVAAPSLARAPAEKPPAPPREKTPLPAFAAPPAQSPPPVKAATPAPIHIPPPPETARMAATGRVPPASPLPPSTARLAPPPTVRAVAEPVLIRPSRNEDWLSMGLAFLLIGIVVAGLRPPMASFKWASDGDFFAAAARCKARIDRLADEATSKGDAEMATAATGLRRAYESGDRTAATEAVKGLAAAAEKSRQEDLQAEARRLEREVGVLAGASIGQVFGQRNLLNSALLGIVILILASLAAGLMGGRLDVFALGFPVLFALAWLAQVIAGNMPNGRWGCDSILVACLLGLLAGNSLGVPAWMREALRSEFYLKTGLVLLGAGFLLPQAFQGNLTGVLQGALIVIVVGIAGYWIARLLRVDEDFSAVLSTSVAVGGVPAAIAAFLAVKGDRRKLPYVVGITFVVSLALIFLMPWIARRFDLSDAVSGIWMGGTIDSPPAIAAAGAGVNEASTSLALNTKATQDALLVVAILILAGIWTRRHGGRLNARPGAALLWGLFPKSILGFIAVSLVFSFALPPAQGEAAQGLLTGLRDTWFALAFVSIGMETRFSDMVRMDRGRPAAAFILTQIFNALCALILATILFGGAPAPLR